MAKELNSYLGTNIVEMEVEHSKFFKDYLAKTWVNRGPMIKEIDVIREEEKW
jgi:hypothetical protein